MKQQIQEKRKELSALSKIVKMGIAAGMYESVNEGLAEMYRQEGHTELNSFRQWLKLGMVVKRGEKALLIWGEPRKGGKQEIPTNGEPDEYKFFPLAYVFSNLQVEKI
jgi:hypothetical protein